MDMSAVDSLRTLTDAHDRGAKLLGALLDEQADLAVHPPALPPDRLAEGQKALANAIASTRRMLDSLEEALRIASTSSN